MALGPGGDAGLGSGFMGASDEARIRVHGWQCRW